MKQKIKGKCPIHGETFFVIEKNAYKRCIRCRSGHVLESRRRTRKRVVEENGGKCKICGYDKCIRALEFHHLDPSIKSFGLSRGGNTRSFEELMEEARKCILVCSNCHREIESGLIDLKQFQTQVF